MSVAKYFGENHRVNKMMGIVVHESSHVLSCISLGIKFYQAKVRFGLHAGGVIRVSDSWLRTALNKSNPDIYKANIERLIIFTAAGLAGEAKYSGLEMGYGGSQNDMFKMVSYIKDDLGASDKLTRMYMNLFYAKADELFTSDGKDTPLWDVTLKIAKHLWDHGSISYKKALKIYNYHFEHEAVISEN